MVETADARDLELIWSRQPAGVNGLAVTTVIESSVGFVENLSTISATPSQHIKLTASQIT
jgi:hypothetical protein